MDRLSELSDEVIHLIFSKLEMRDVVRTTLLSKRWVNLWTTVTCLDFQISNSETERNFVNRVLENWKGTKIEVFGFEAQYYYWLSSLNDDMSNWISFAIARNVEELHIINNSFMCYHPDDDPATYNNPDDDLEYVFDISYFSPPDSLYSCSSIRELTLFGCNVETSSNVCWDRLKSLVIRGGEISRDTINRVLSGSPQLENLIFFLWERPHKMNIRSSSLITLEIDSRHRVSSSDELTIWAPKLEELRYYGASHSKFLMMDVFSLNSVVLGFTEEEHYDDMEESEKAILRETLAQILRATRNAESVHLSTNCCELLRDMEGERRSFSNAKLLTVVCFPIRELQDMVGILETFPKLERLIICWSSLHKNQNVNLGDLQDVGEQPKNLDYLLPRMSMVEIRLDKYDGSMFVFIESLLKHATEVRKIVIWNTGDPMDRSKYREMIETKAASFQSFPKLEKVFYRH